MIIQSNNLAEFKKIARNLAGGLRGGEVIGLTGELGAGKTTFVRFLAMALGVKDKVLSPTFVLLKIYRISRSRSNIRQLVHVDAYRLPGEEALKNIGLLEYLGRSDTVVVIEWADQVKKILPAGLTMVKIKAGKAAGQRKIRISRAA